MSNFDFNKWLDSLPVEKKVVGVLADGTELTVEVPVLSFGGK